MIEKIHGGYMLKCPECKRERIFKWKYLAVTSLTKNRLCKVCVHKGDRNYLYGKTISPEIREKMGKSKKGRKFNDLQKKKLSSIHKKRYSSLKEREKTSVSVKKAIHTPDIRKKHLDALHHSKWVKVRTDKGQLELLEKWNKLGFSFEPNFQLKTDLDLFYIDGYDSKNNVILEYDSKYHKNPSQKEKDLIRQKKIIDVLHPKKFWRYDSVDKQFRNILGD
jgi:hypothetical protein